MLGSIAWALDSNEVNRVNFLRDEVLENCAMSLGLYSPETLEKLWADHKSEIRLFMRSLKRHLAPYGFSLSTPISHDTYLPQMVSWATIAQRKDRLGDVIVTLEEDMGYYWFSLRVGDRGITSTGMAHWDEAKAHIADLEEWRRPDQIKPVAAGLAAIAKKEVGPKEWHPSWGGSRDDV